MSQTTQARILDEIQKRVIRTPVRRGSGSPRYTLTVDHTAANVGVLGAVGPDDVVAANRMSFDFQRDYATFRRVGVAIGALDRDNVHLRYEHGPAKAEEAVQAVVSFLTTGSTAR